MSESKARAIREDAGQAGKGFGPQGCSSPWKQQRVVRDNRLVLLTLTAKTNLPPVERLVPTCSLRIRSQKKYRTPLPPRVDESRQPPICEAGAAISASAKPLTCWFVSPVGSGCGCGPLYGGSGKRHAVAGPLCWHWEFGRAWPATRPAAVVALGTSRRARPFLWGSLMPTSNRSDFQR